MVDIKCYINARDRFSKELQINNCNCLPDCTSVTYDVETSQVQSQFSDRIAALRYELNETTYVFKSFEFERINEIDCINYIIKKIVICFFSIFNLFYHAFSALMSTANCLLHSKRAVSYRSIERKRTRIQISSLVAGVCWDYSWEYRC